MKNKTPANPHTAPLSVPSEPEAPSVQEQLALAINALRALQRSRVAAAQAYLAEAAAIGRLLGDA